jgi:pimeloyl-ACP methyl ester carboxylesterase
VLRGTAAGGAALTGLTAFSGSAAAGSCLELTKQDAPPDFPIIDENYDYYGSVPWNANEITIFVHGWQAELGGDAWGQSYLCKQALDNQRYGGRVIGFKYWASNVWWPTAKDDAHDAGRALANWVDWFVGRGTSIRLIGHSLGGHTTLQCLKSLQNKSSSVRSLSLVGPAVDTDSVAWGGTWADGVANSAGRVDNFHSRSDNVLEYIYSIGEFGDQALGEEGADGSTPWNYSDVDVTQKIGDHCEYFQPGNGCIDDVAARF